MTDALPAPVVNEFNTIDLGDARRNRRLQSVVETLWAHPGASFPVAFGSSAPTAGFYRLVEGTGPCCGSRGCRGASTRG